jgi:hypothetical protein
MMATPASISSIAMGQGVVARNHMYAVPPPFTNSKPIFNYLSHTHSTLAMISILLQITRRLPIVNKSRVRAVTSKCNIGLASTVLLYFRIRIYYWAGLLSVAVHETRWKHDPYFVAGRTTLFGVRVSMRRVAAKSSIHVGIKESRPSLI